MATDDEVRAFNAARDRAAHAEAEVERMQHPAYVPPHLKERVRLARWAQQLHADVQAAMFLLEQQPPSEPRDGLIATIQAHLAQIDAQRPAYGTPEWAARDTAIATTTSHTVGCMCYRCEGMRDAPRPTAPAFHFGRAWSGHEIEDACPCPQAPCGLVSSHEVRPDCGHHAMVAAKTLRQRHVATECPAGEGRADG